MISKIIFIGTVISIIKCYNRLFRLNSNLFRKPKLFKRSKTIRTVRIVQSSVATNCIFMAIGIARGTNVLFYCLSLLLWLGFGVAYFKYKSRHKDASIVSQPAVSSVVRPVVVETVQPVTRDIIQQTHLSPQTVMEPSSVHNTDTVRVTAIDSRILSVIPRDILAKHGTNTEQAIQEYKDLYPEQYRMLGGY